MPLDENRLLLEFEKLLRETNRKYINGAIRRLGIDDLKPVTDLIARVRTAYLQYIFELSHDVQPPDLPSEEQLAKLSGLRLMFSELLEASQAFEVAIKRGYLDCSSTRG